MQQSEVIRVTESTFRRVVLDSPLPVLVCFATQHCAGYNAMRSTLEHIVATSTGTLVVAFANSDRVPLLVESYGIDSSPMLISFHGGDPQGRVRGFLPEGLLKLFAHEIIQGKAVGNTCWNPTEAQFEDAVLIPLLEYWDFAFGRQVACSLPSASTRKQGQIDLLLYDHPQAQPFSLIESKRRIIGFQDLQKAVTQATWYAQSLWLPSFVVACPSNLWVYRRQGTSATCIHHMTSLDLHKNPNDPQRLLLSLRYER